MELERLRRKYESILELRLRKAALQAGDDRADVENVRALAREFPGALRDLDALALGEVHDRIEAIVAAELDPVNMKPWMIAELVFYEAMRGALAVKSWLGKRREITDELRGDFNRALATHQHADEARAWHADIALIARPPRGRLVDLAMSRVAGKMGVSAKEARALVFRHPKKTNVAS